MTDGAIRLFAADAGEGPALFFLHGGLADHRAVLPLVQPLSDRYRIVAPDLRGSGRSWSSEPLTFERLSEDLLRLMDDLNIETAFIGGVSSGSGPALHFVLHHPERVLGLIVVHPVYAGSERGYTNEQAAEFARMDAVASRAPVEGVDVLRTMYLSRLPEAMAERAWAMASDFDAGSVAATSRFIASGAQPFEAVRELATVAMPTLLVRGDDAIHPSEISDLYAESLPEVTEVPAEDEDTARAIRSFMDSVLGDRRTDSNPGDGGRD